MISNYEEKIFGRVLHYRTSVADTWVRFTPEELTVKLMEARGLNVKEDVVVKPLSETWPVTTPACPAPSPWTWHPTWLPQTSTPNPGTIYCTSADVEDGISLASSVFVADFTGPFGKWED